MRAPRRLPVLAVLRPDRRCRSGHWRPPTKSGSTPSGTGASSASRCTSTAFCCSAAGSHLPRPLSSRSGRRWSTRPATCSTRRRAAAGCSTPGSTTTSARIWRADALADLGVGGRDAGEDRGRRRAARRRRRDRQHRIAAPWPSSSRPPNSRCPPRWPSTRCATRSPMPTPVRVGHQCVGARMLAGAFAVAWEWENTELISELIEYHSARGTFSAEPADVRSLTGPRRQRRGSAPIATSTSSRSVAAGPPSSGGGALTRLGPLPPLQMDPTAVADPEPTTAHWRSSGTAGTSPPTKPPGRRGRDRPADPRPAVRRRRHRHLRQPAGGRRARKNRHLGGRGTDLCSRRSTNSPARCRIRAHAESRGGRRRARARRGPVRGAGHRTGRSPTVLGAPAVAERAWQLLAECVASPRAVLFVSPSARLARVPWGLLAMPADRADRLTRHRLMETRRTC